MNIPKIIEVSPKNNLILTVLFSNGSERNFDCNNILNRNEHYRKLSDIIFFKNVNIDIGGHGVSWNDYVDISGYETLANSINGINDTELIDK